MFAIGLLILWMQNEGIYVNDCIILFIGCVILTCGLFAIMFFTASPEQNARNYGDLTNTYKVGYTDFIEGYNKTYIELGENGNDFSASCYKLGYEDAQHDAIVNKERSIIKNRMSSV
jgi:hypothetical protein